MVIKVRKIKKTMTFKHKKWLKPNNDLNTEPRSKAKNGFREKICRGMNNNIAGKFVEDVEEKDM